ncbi:MAG: ribose-phosphate pyrophosphokinase [Alphaproteobacteria bacterium]|jgi:ribose-phosphate pyrophosphokinase|nr:ribose-phosphate pyrophosphokinase [Alphaproteobacteria bacterium]
MKPLLLALPGNEAIGESLAGALAAEYAIPETRQFPDGETYLRLNADIKARDIILVCSLDRPDPKFLPLIFLAETAREMGARSVGLICPYLAYMRQDARFKPGEGITSAYFARALGQHFDWLATVDPHLHRYRSLSEIYAIPAAAVHAGPAIAAWVRDHVPAPLIIGPDSESAQWVAAVAREANAPYIVLEKHRHGDRKVEVSAPDMQPWRGRTPVLVDDIISTAHTLIAATRRLLSAGASGIIVIGIHGLFADRAYDELRAMGVSQIVSCNTVTHPSNAIDVTALLAKAVEKLTRA